MAFYRKYFPVYEEHKELEFMRLQQGNMSMAEYTAKFKELGKFLTIYQWNLDEGWKCVKFERGLREDFLALIGPMKIRDMLPWSTRAGWLRSSTNSWLWQDLRHTRRSGALWLEVQAPKTTIREAISI